MHKLNRRKLEQQMPQFDIFSQIDEQIDNEDITPQQVKEFINDDRKVAEIEPIVENLEGKANNAEELANLKRDS
jgi:hypothetical protein